MLKNHLELTADRCGTGRWYLNIDGGNLTCASLEEAKSIILRELGAVTPGWISVEERLPEQGENVLVCFENGDMSVASVFDKDENITFWRAVTDEGWVCDCDTEPTHWMPLPEPPKGGKL